jgi:flagellar biosynthetic protein FliR
VPPLELSTPTLLALLLGTVRASAWLLVCPPFSSRLIPAPVKALLALALALPMTPMLTAQVPELAVGPLLLSAVEQVVVGTALGFVTSLFFAAVQAAGNMIDVFGGFSMSFSFDPLSQAQTSVFGKFYNLIAITLLFASDGHLMVMRGFLQSYKALPLDDTLSLGRLGRLMTEGVGEMFLAAMQIAGPLIAVLLLTDVAFGLLTRVAPALNAFVLSFPAKIFITLALAGSAIAVLPKALSDLVESAVRAVLGLTGA